MKAERSITAARHSAGRTIDKLSEFAAAVLTARHYPHADQVGAQLRALAPLFNLLLAKRTVGSPALVVRSGDMRIGLRVEYDMNAEENLSVPSMDLLDELPADAEVEVSVLATEEVAAPLAELVSKVDGKPALVTLTVAAPEEAEPSKPGTDVPPEPAEAREEEPPPEDTVPTPAEDATRPEG
ncbi:hypothetical protein [Actinoplanes siamensis]|uniref:Uncharacterized protein n=1 Tax=Actinoplanes siamensis TaxID=1223317 RepID=A0A919NF80_9ACTN|nr:hypothetical protein [Actinoplanes siamensis]GIF09768.1 hypothetical protein Asi03nite_73060 [Actinoplanes siamensis]